MTSHASSATAPDIAAKTFNPQPDPPGLQTNAKTFDPQLGPPGLQASVDIAFDITSFELVYQASGIHSPTYKLTPWAGPQPVQLPPDAPFNTPRTPFLLPSAVELFGGELRISSQSTIPVYWKVVAQLTDNGVAITTTDGFAQAEVAAVTAAVQPATTALTGYTPIMINHPGLYEPQALPTQQPVLMTLTLLAFSDAAYVHPMKDSTPANNQLSIWLMRTA